MRVCARAWVSEVVCASSSFLGPHLITVGKKNPLRSNAWSCKITPELRKYDVTSEKNRVEYITGRK